MERPYPRRRVEPHRLRKRNIPHQAGHAGGRVQAGTKPAPTQVGHLDSTRLRGMNIWRNHLSAGQARLEISQHRIDPVEYGPLFGVFPADHEGLVRATRFCHRTEAVQAIREDRAARAQVVFGPGGDSRQGKTGNGGELDEGRVVFVIHRHRRHERYFVFRTASRLAPVRSPPK